MGQSYKVAVIVGSLRQGSYSRMAARALIALAPPSISAEIAEIGNLELYNQDLDPTPPASWVEFKRQIKEADAVLFVTPEYNRGVPGVLKNAIDVASRPYGDSAWEGKPGAVVSVSPGKIGAFGANHHLRQSLVFLNVPAMQQPEAYIGGAAQLFDGNGGLTDESVREFLANFMAAFAMWIEKHLGYGQGAAA